MSKFRRARKKTVVYSFSKALELAVNWHNALGTISRIHIARPGVYVIQPSYKCHRTHGADLIYRIGNVTTIRRRYHAKD